MGKSSNQTKTEDTEAKEAEVEATEAEEAEVEATEEAVVEATEKAEVTEVLDDSSEEEEGGKSVWLIDADDDASAENDVPFYRLGSAKPYAESDEGTMPAEL